MAAPASALPTVGVCRVTRGGDTVRRPHSHSHQTGLPSLDIVLPVRARPAAPFRVVPAVLSGAHSRIASCHPKNGRRWVPVTDLAGADAVVLVGANVAETMPPFVRHLARARERGGLVVIDPRRTATAELATLHLRPAPGTDLALALGLLHAAVADGLVDEGYVRERTTGFEQAWRVAAGWWPERVERVTGVAAADQRACVRILAQAASAAAVRRGGTDLPGAGGTDLPGTGRTDLPGIGGTDPAGGAYLLTGRGTEQHATGTDTVSAWINLCLAIGLPGRPGSGYGCLTGQGNGQGGREQGQKADQLPGYRRIDDPAARAHVAAVWGVDAAALPGPGRSAFELLDSLGAPDGPRALLVFGSNVVVSAPAAARVADRLAALDLLVVADVVLSETAALADVVFLPFHFPGAQRANLVTNPALDPTSRMPEFKVCVVRLQPAAADPNGPQ